MSAWSGFGFSGWVCFVKLFFSTGPDILNMKHVNSFGRVTSSEFPGYECFLIISPSGCLGVQHSKRAYRTNNISSYCAERPNPSSRERRYSMVFWNADHDRSFSGTFWHAASDTIFPKGIRVQLRRSSFRILGLQNDFRIFATFNWMWIEKTLFIVCLKEMGSNETELWLLAISTGSIWPRV